MEKKSTAQTTPARRSRDEGGFFNLRALILIALFTGSIVAALFATVVDERMRRGETKPVEPSSWSATARSAQMNELWRAPAGTANWVWQNPLPEGNNLIDVKMLDANTGIAVGWGGTILRTTDGGQNWSLIDVGNLINTFQGYYFYRLSVVGGNTIWAAGQSSTPDFTESHALLIKSTDGGLTWMANYTGDPQSILLDTQFIDANHGIAVGYDAINFWDVLRTTDGGNTWAPSFTGESNLPLGVFFTDLNTGTIVNASGEILRTTDGGNNWVFQNSGTNQFLRSVYFTDSNTGTAVGGQATILRTTNGGSTWVSQLCPLTNDHNLLSVFFTDTNNGWITTSSGITDSGYILRTTDGGTTWVIQTQAPYPDLTALQSICLSDTNGIVVGDYGLTLRTTDGGNSWAQSQSSSEVTLNELHGVSFTDPNTGLAVGYAGTLLKTSDGGSTWSQLPNTGNFNNSVYLIDEMTGWMASEEMIGSSIYKTTDGGNTWVSVYHNQAVGLKGIYFVSSQIGWACGDQVGPSSLILKTSDGGTTWIEQAGGTTTRLRVVDFVDQNTGWVGGGDPGGAGEILSTTDGGNSWVSQTSTASPITDLHFIDSAVGWAVGGDISGGNAEGILLKTTDGGLSWTNQSYNSNAALYGVRFIDANNGMAVGAYLIISSTDGGNIWIRENIPQGKEYFALSMLDPDNVTVVGEVGNIIARRTGITPTPTATPSATPTPTPTSTPRPIPTPRPRPTPLPRPTPPG